MPGKQWLFYSINRCQIFFMLKTYFLFAWSSNLTGRPAFYLPNPVSFYLCREHTVMPLCQSAPRLSSGKDRMKNHRPESLWFLVSTTLMSQPKFPCWFPILANRILVFPLSTLLGIYWKFCLNPYSVDLSLWLHKLCLLLDQVLHDDIFFLNHELLSCT